MSGLAETIDDFSTGTYRVRRSSAGSLVDGHYARIAELERDATSVSAATNLLAVAAHGVGTGFGPVYLSTTGTVPGGADANVSYWLIAPDADHLGLATSKANALALTYVDLTDAGTGTLHVSTSFTIDASVQPVDGDLLKDLPEGVRVEDFQVMWTRSQLLSETRDNDADVVVIDGRHYRVTKVAHFTILDDFYRAFVERLEVLR